MKGTYPTKVEQPFEGDDKVYYVNGGRCSGKVDKLINELVDYINELRKENRKYKEAIDKAIEYLEQKPVVMVNGEPREIYVEDDNKLLDILNEGKNE